MPNHSLDELIQQSSNIFEGTIVDKHAFWDVDSLHIITAHTVQVKQSSTDKTTENVIILTPGGQVNDDYMAFSGASHFQNGDSGVFFTNPTNYNIIKQTGYTYLSLTNSQHHFLNRQAENVQMLNNNYTLQQVYQKIEKATKSNFKYLPNAPESAESQKLLASILNISPLNLPADGTHTLTITGTGFGTLNGDASISMPNSNFSSGVSYITIPKKNITHWSNSLIQIKVPGFDILTSFPGVGSGLVKIQTANGNEVTSTQKVVVSYNHKKLDGKNIDLISHSNKGDMPFYISKQLIDDGALPAIERAMDLWYCQTGIQFSIVGTVNETCYKVDNKNVISYDDDCSINQLGYTRLLVSSCSSQSEVYLRDLDIIINRNKNWDFDLELTSIGSSDFTSTILHEMGHAHLLGHVLNKEDILYPIIVRTETKKELIENNKNGGSQILVDSKNQNGCTNYKPQIPFNDGFCCSPLNKLTVNYITAQSAVINFEHTLKNTNVQVRYRKFGHSNWNVFTTNNSNLLLGDLQDCSSYEVQVSDACRNEEEVQFSEGNAVLFETKGCISCDPPGELFFAGVSSNSAFLNWDVVPNRLYYEMQYRVDYSGTWKYYQTVYPFVILFDLPACTAVQYRIKTYCGEEDISSFSGIRTLKTLCDEGRFSSVLNEYSFSLAPNPVTSHIIISTKYTNFTNTYFILKNIKGSILHKEKLLNNNHVLNIQNLKSGIYFIEFFQNGEKIVQKFIKE